LNFSQSGDRRERSRAEALGHDPLEAHPAGVLEHGQSIRVLEVFVQAFMTALRRMLASAGLEANYVVP
jgi:hypothetical protein